MAELRMADIKIAGIIKLSQNEWVKIFKFVMQMLGTNLGRVWVSLRERTKMAESKMTEFNMTAIIKLGENEWVWVRLN